MHAWSFILDKHGEFTGTFRAYFMTQNTRIHTHFPPHSQKTLPNTRARARAHTHTQNSFHFTRTLDQDFLTSALTNTLTSWPPSLHPNFLTSVPTPQLPDLRPYTLTSWPPLACVYMCRQRKGPQEHWEEQTAPVPCKFLYMYDICVWI